MAGVETRKAFGALPVAGQAGVDMSHLDDVPWMKNAGPEARKIRPRPGQKLVNLGLISLYDVENNATRLIAACARKAGYRVVEIFFKDWINNHLDWPRPEELASLIHVIRENDLGLVGLSIRASAYHKVAAQLTRHIKEHCPWVTILWGGTHVVLDPDKCARVPGVDIVCRGEGEITVVQLLDRLSAQADITDLPNIYVRRPDGEWVKNPVGPTVQNLDDLPFRDYTSPDKYFILGKKLERRDPMVDDPMFQMMCSRGCVFVCAYCYNSQLSDIYKGKGRYFRTRSVASVLQEIHEARKVFRRMKRIRFDDEVFPSAWYDEFCERYPKEVGLPFEVFIEPKLVKEDLFRRLKAAGQDVVYMGVQNTYRITHDLYDRYVSNEQIQYCARLFHELGISARYQVILDDPESDEEDRRGLFNLLMSFPRPYELYLFSIVIFPNTKLAHRLLAAGKITEADLEDERMKTFQQIRVSLNYPRPPMHKFWAAMLVLITKNFLPKKFLYWLADNKFLRQHPDILVWFAQFCNLIKMGYIFFKMLFKGEMSWTLIRHWSNPNSLITQ
jgi:radical SAM superfamily enzyme YgiQ (UPF0313 family)